MKIILLVLSILFITCNAEISGNNTRYLKFRNLALRKILTDDYKQMRKILDLRHLKNTKYLSRDKIIRIYDKLISKYYDASGEYYKLSEEDKSILEFIFSLTY